jgi:hypothetical protein
MNQMRPPERPRPDGTGGRLGILQLVTTSLQSLSLCHNDAIRLAAVPALLHVIANIYGQAALYAVVEAAKQGTNNVDPAVIGRLLLTAIVMVSSSTLLAVNWFRFLLLGAQSTPGLGLNIGRPHLLFLLGAMALGFVAVISLGIASIPIGLILRGGASIGFALAALAIGMVMVRLFLALVAVAINQPVGLKQAWEASRGQGITLLIAVLLIEAPFVLAVWIIGSVADATGFTEIAPYTVLLVSSLVEVAATMAQCGVLAAAYRRLIGVRA